MGPCLKFDPDIYRQEILIKIGQLQAEPNFIAKIELVCGLWFVVCGLRFIVYSFWFKT
jgi:hypothetical protein